MGQFELRDAGIQFVSVDEYDRFRSRSELLVSPLTASEAVVLGVLVPVLPVYATLVRAYKAPSFNNPPGKAGQQYRFQCSADWLIVRSGQWWTSYTSPFIGVVLGDIEVLLGPSIRARDYIQHYEIGRFCIAGELPSRMLTEYIAWHLSYQNYPHELG